MTAGNWINSKYQEVAKQYLEPGGYLVEVNEKWSCIVQKGDEYIKKISIKNFSSNLLELSMLIPVMFLYGHPDTTFNFAIFSKKEIVSRFRLNDLTMFRGGWVTYSYPSSTEDDAQIDKTLKIIAEAGFGPYSEGFNPDTSKLFKDLNLQNFKLFDCSDEQMTALEELFTYDFCDRYTIYLFRQFQNTLDISKASNLHWSYIDEFGLAKVSPDSRLICRG